MEEKECIRGGWGTQGKVEMERFKVSTAYEEVLKYLTILDKKIQDEEVLGDTEERYGMYNIMFKSEEEKDKTEKAKINEFLSYIVQIIKEVPQEKEEQRYGNPGFITFANRICKEGESIIKKTFFSGKSSRETETLQKYLQGSFGNQTRIDYGTGHELNFFCFLIVLHMLGKIEIEEFLIGLEHYFSIIRILILKYNLEPAGSHGSWGIDDYQLLPFLFGSSQFCKKNNLVFSSLFLLKNKGLCYAKALRFIHVHKTCSARTHSFEERVKACNEIEVPEESFSYHSPNSYMLKDVSFAKINKGMMKMYNSVVLSEYVVIQHFISSEYLPI